MKLTFKHQIHQTFNMDMYEGDKFHHIKACLDEYGYVIIPDTISREEIDKAKTLFYNWLSSIDNLDYIHKKVNPHGIFKFHEAGHQEHAWYLRTLESVQKPFKYIYDTNDLIVSYDGSCFINSTFNKSRDNTWIHTDQAPCNSDFQCLQGFVSLTDNINTSLVVYEGSHKLHKQYFKERNITHKKNWNKIDPEFLDIIGDKKKVLTVPAGSLVLWDSRTFHANQYGSPSCEERIVQYVCYLPKSHPRYTKAIQNKRLKYFHEKRTTSHWPCPIYVNGLQPRTFGDDSLHINYESLKHPDLTPYIDDIMKLL